MDAVFFSMKRGFHATLRFGRKVLGPLGLTPARFDVLYALTDERVTKTQAGLRRALGVARATISEMLDALEDLGWVRRSRCPHDWRTHDVCLTAAGRSVFERAYRHAIGEGTVPIAVDSALTPTDEDTEFTFREEIEALSGFLRRYFGDYAMRELYPWHYDEYLSALLDVDATSTKLLELVPERPFDFRVIDLNVEAR